MKLYLVSTMVSCLLLSFSDQVAAGGGCSALSPTTAPVVTTTTAPLTPATTTATPSTPDITTEAPSTSTDAPEVTTEAPTTPVATTEPDTEAPATEAPVTEAPVTEAPATEAPVTEAPVTEAPVTEAPVTEAPVTEAPATEAPATEAPVTEAPVTESPVTDAPATAAPVTEAPTATVTSTPSTTEPTSNSSLTRFLDASTFASTFPNAVTLYDFQGLVDAATNQYPTFANSGDDTADKRELAAFLAQTAHESDSFQAAEEYGWASYPESQYCDTSTGVECVAGQRYHGRGPIQISWNYNYNSAGQALGIDLLSDPEVVATDSAVAWATGLWFWMTPQKNGLVIHDVVTLTDGFATSTDIINGGLECGGPNAANEQQRIEYFEEMCTLLGVEPLGKTSCNA